MENVCAIVLAAGAGRRFGGRKMLAPFRGGPLVEAALAAAFAAPTRSVLLVTGADQADVASVAVAASRRWPNPERLRIVHAERHAQGMSASLQAGLAALPADCGGCFVFLGDMPCVPHDVAGRLLSLAETSGAAAASPVHDGRRGHPVLLRASLFEAFEQLSGDAGAGRLLAGLGARLALLPVDDDGVLFDVDEPSDTHRDGRPPAGP